MTISKAEIYRELYNSLQQILKETKKTAYPGTLFDFHGHAAAFDTAEGEVGLALGRVNTDTINMNGLPFTRI